MALGPRVTRAIGSTVVEPSKALVCTIIIFLIGADGSFPKANHLDYIQVGS